MKLIWTQPIFDVVSILTEAKFQRKCYCVWWDPIMCLKPRQTNSCNKSLYSLFLITKKQTPTWLLFRSMECSAAECARPGIEQQQIIMIFEKLQNTPLGKVEQNFNMYIYQLLAVALISRCELWQLYDLTTLWTK